MVTFLDRTSPASSMAKPAAIKNTKKPPMRNSNVFIIQAISEGTVFASLSENPLVGKRQRLTAKPDVVR